jgi:hypothetical protein
MESTKSSAVVYIGTPQRASQVLGTSLILGNQLIKVSADYCSIQLPAGKVRSLAGKKKTDEEGGEPSSNIIQNQHVAISLPEYNYQPKRYKFIISVNPALLEVGQVSTPGLVSRTDLNNVFITLSTFKAVDLAELDWVFSITAID